jgi:hypothetical protein
MSAMAMLAGSVSTVLFGVSTLPMLIKAARTKELSSYSRGNLVLAQCRQRRTQHLRLSVAAWPDLGPTHLLCRHIGTDALLAPALCARYAPDQAASSLSRELLMTIEHIQTAIIGAGQAGLATAYHLQQRGRPCVILDGNR